MNGAMSSSQTTTISRTAKPPPAGPTPPAPPTTQPALASPSVPASAKPPQNHAPAVNGAYPTQKARKKNDLTPVDPTTMYESLKNRIAALEEEEVQEEEEERQYGTGMFSVAFIIQK